MVLIDTLATTPGTVAAPVWIMPTLPETTVAGGGTAPGIVDGGGTGTNWPVELMRYIECIESCLGRKAQKNLLPLQPGDVPDTFADIDDLVRDVGYRPATPVEVGVERFVRWYVDYYKQG